MALDEALLESVAAGRSGPVLRLYRWLPAAVTLGYFQHSAEAVNFAACRELGIEVVRRCTGGRAVLHAHEATYAVISPARSDLFPGSVLENYRVIAAALREAIAALGLDASLAPGRARGRSGDGVRASACFTAPSSYELVYRGCKLTGSAQKRRGEAFLQHGSIPVDLDLERLFRALDVDGRLPPAAGAERLASCVGWLNRWLVRPVTVETVEEALVAAAVRCWEVRLVESEPTVDESARAAQLLTERYADPAWTLRPAARG
jgi:lipoate-protein ligase A